MNREGPLQLGLPAGSCNSSPGGDTGQSAHVGSSGLSRLLRGRDFLLGRGLQDRRETAGGGPSLGTPDLVRRCGLLGARLGAIGQLATSDEAHEAGVVALAEEATNRGGLHEASAETEGRRGLLLQSSRGGRDGLQDRLGLGRHDGSREAIRDRLLPLLLRGSVRGGEKGEKGEGRSDDSGATTRHFHSPSQLVD